MSFCLLKEQADKFIQALKDGVIDPGKLAEMSSLDRHVFFSKIVGEGDAKEVNALFESKLLLKNQQAGMINWAKKVANLSEKARSDLISRIGRMDKVLTAADQKSFLADLASKKLGTDVTYEEAQKIVKLSRAVREAQVSGTENMSGVSDEFLKAKANLGDYVESLKPHGILSGIGRDIATIGRNNLLLNPSTLLKTSSGQFVNSLMEGVMRRISTLSLSGANGDLVSKAGSEAWDTFKKTGVNVAGMESMNDYHILGKGESGLKAPTGMTEGGKVLTTVESGVKKVAQLSNKVAIDWQHVIPFTKVYQSAFYDMVNVFASKIAEKEGLVDDGAKIRSAEIIKDAARIEPKTDAGKMVRSQAQQSAARVTSTNDTIVSKFSLGMKNLLNQLGKPAGVPLGDLVIPIAKIPATLFANTVENAGLGLITGGKDLYTGFKNIQSENLTTRYEGMSQMQRGYQTLARTVGSMGLAALVASQYTKKDFRTDPYGAHFVKIGNYWINMEYISVISPALAGFMSAKEGKNLPDDVYKYASGAVYPAFKGIPGVDELSQIAATGVKKYIPTAIQQRAYPQFIQNMFKDRPINRLFFGATGVETQAQVNADNKAKAKASAASRAANKK